MWIKDRIKALIVFLKFTKKAMWRDKVDLIMWLVAVGMLIAATAGVNVSYGIVLYVVYCLRVMIQFQDWKEKYVDTKNPEP